MALPATCSVARGVCSINGTIVLLTCAVCRQLLFSAVLAYVSSNTRPLRRIAAAAAMLAAGAGAQLI
jgi:hypothetical protein